MAQQTNFPVANFKWADENGQLTKEARTLLRTIWLASAGAPNQTGWANSTTTVNKGPLGNYSGSTTPAVMAAQISLLTQVLGTLINALGSYGILND